MRCGNSIGFSFLVFSLSITACRCGILNLFDEWTNAIQPREIKSGNEVVKCREKREVTVENGITPEIRSPDQTVSLIDIEEGKLVSDGQEKHAEGKTKSKRCPKEYVGLPNPLLGSPLLTSRFGGVQKAHAGDHNSIPCQVNDKACIESYKCTECQNICQAVQPKPDDNQILGLSPRFASSGNQDDLLSRIMYPVSTYKAGETKEIISKIAGIKNPEDVESVIIWVTTRSNKPPKVLGSILQESSPGKDELNSNTQSKKQNVKLNMKPRFNDYDDFGSSNARIFEKSSPTNPDVIEGPPPFMRSSIDNVGQSAPKEPDNIQNQKDATLGSSNDNIIVQPKEFQSDESDENDDIIEEPTPSTLKKKLDDLKNSKTPLRTNSKISKGGFFQNLFMPRHALPEPKTPKPTAAPVTIPVMISRGNIPIPEKSDLNEALNGVKDMLKTMQEDAKKASEQRLLGAKHSSEHLIHPAVPPHVVKNVKDVNKYILDRAQDALDTIGTSDNDINANAGTHEHSQVTKDIIKNVKKMPQYLLEKLKSTFDGLEKVSKPVIEDQKLGMSGRTAMDDNDLIGAPVQATSSTEKSKWDLYQKNLKDRRQKLYSPEKYNKPGLIRAAKEMIGITDLTVGEASPTEVPNKAKFLPTLPAQNNLINYLQSLKTKSPPLTNKLAEINNNKDPEPIVEAVDPLKEDAKPALKDKLKTLVEDMAAKTAARNNAIEETLKNLVNNKKPLAPHKDEHFVPIIGAKEPNSLVHRNSLPVNLNGGSAAEDAPGLETNEFNKLNEATSPKKDILGDNVKTYFDDIKAKTAAKIDEANVKLGENVKNYLDNLKKPLEVPKIPPSVSSISNAKPEAREKVPVLGQKLNELTANNPITNTILTPESLDKEVPLKVQNSSEPAELVKNTAEPNQTDKKSLLKSKLRNFVDDLRSRSSALSNRLSDLSNLDQNRNILGEKLKSLQKPLIPSAKPRFGDAESENSIIDDASILGEPEHKKPTLRERMKTFVDSLPKRMPEATQNRLKTTPELIRSPIETTKNSLDGKLSDSVAAENQANGDFSPKDKKDMVLGSTNSFKEAEAVKKWTNSLGQIVQQPSNPKDIFFLGSGVKLPLKISHGKDGSMDLSVDLEKLCSCHNSTTCPANHTTIDETVGAILEKEAELKEQLGTPERVKRYVLLSKIFKRSVPEDILKTTYDNTVQQWQKGATNLGNEVAKNINTILKDPTLEDVNSQFLKTRILTGLDNLNVISNRNDMIKKYEKDRIVKKLLNQMSTTPKILDPEEGLKKLTEQFEQSQADLSNKIETDLENLEIKMPDWYQKSKINSLENKLKELDDKVLKYNTENEKTVAKQSQSILGQPSKVVENELNIIKNVFDWISSIQKSYKYLGI